MSGRCLQLKREAALALKRQIEVMADRDNLREEVKSMRKERLSWRIAGRDERKETDCGAAVWILIRGLRANLFRSVLYEVGDNPPVSSLSERGF